MIYRLTSRKYNFGMLSREIFANPPSCYRPIPFWFWNSKLNARGIESQVQDFYEKGLGGFFIHGRFGLETDYLSKEWLDLVEHAVKVAEKLGMEVWLYDENGFPSGIGDLKVSRVKEFRPKFLELDDDGEYSLRTLEDPDDTVFGIDYLNPHAVQAFFDLTLNTYEEHLGKYFGKTIKGIFTDEPTLLPWHHDINWYGQRKHTRVVIWNHRIEEELERRTGAPAAKLVRHLFYDIDSESPAIRRTFWEVVAELYISTFFRPYAEWCEKRGLKLTGHVLFEEGLYLNTLFQADFPQVINHFHIPGTDHLGNITECAYGGFENTPRQLTNVQGQKLVASIVHLTSKESVLSETYGCAGWELSFANMKRILDWQYTLGINFLCPHALFYSVEGFRKWDAPPSHNHMTGWKSYRGFADYVARLSYILRQGRHVAKVAVYYPMREFRECYKIGTETECDRRISDAFDLCASVLLELHFDYDIVPESFLAQAQIRDGCLYIGEERYECLVAPETVLTSNAGAVVSRFVQQGGKWIRPPMVTGEASRQVVASYLKEALISAIVPDVQICSPEAELVGYIRYVHREIDGKHVFFFANTSDAEVPAELSLEATGNVEMWNPETGTVSQCRSATIKNGRLTINHSFPPYGSAIYLVDSRYDGPLPKCLYQSISRRQIAILPDEWRFETHDLNALPLEKLKLHMYSADGGMTYLYSTHFRCEAIPDKLFLMLDDVEYRSSLMGGMDLTIQINETNWHKPQMASYIDKGFKTLDIRPAIRLGDNLLTIKIRHSAWSGQPHLLNAPPALLGTFACNPETLTLLPPVCYARSGSWTEFGYPFYSGSGSYTQVFDITDLPDNQRIIVSLDGVRDMVEIVVNGQTAETRLWPPWEADITNLLRIGDNELTLRITNSRANFFEAKRHTSGLIGLVRLLAQINE